MDWWLIKFFEMSLNHKELLRFSVPKVGAGIAQSRNSRLGHRGCWGHRDWPAELPLLSHPLLTPAGRKEAGSWSSSGSGCKSKAQGTVGVWE